MLAIGLALAFFAAQAASVSAASTQSLSILGAVGTGVDSTTDWSPDVVAWDSGISSTGAWHFTGNGNPSWHPAYRVGGHPWGQVPGTSTWLNCGPSTSSSQCGASGGNVVAFRVRFSLPAGSVNPNITFWINSDNAGTYYINGTQVTDRLVGGGGTGANPLGPSGCSSGSAPYCPAGVRTVAMQSALHSGVNEMVVIMEDWGGLSGFNYRADITVTADSPPVIVPPTQTPSHTSITFNGGQYTGSAFTASASTDFGTTSIAYSGDCVNAGNTCSATATSTGDANHTGSSASASIVITKAPSHTSITFNGGQYTGSAFAASASTDFGTTSIAYSGDCVNAGDTCSATATSTGDANHDSSSSASASIVITKAPSHTSVTFNGGQYTGSAFTATASTDFGTTSIAYSGDCTNAGNTCSATATSTGDANHDGSSASAGITITKAPSHTSITFNGGQYTGSAFTATASTDFGTTSIAYSGDCVNAGNTCSATATSTGDANHDGSSASASITITYQICGATGDDGKGRQSGSTIPVKLRVCNAAGQSIGSSALPVKAIRVSPAGSLNDSGKANPGNLFRFDGGTYIFNLSTKGLAAGNYTLDYTVGNDPTVYHYTFSIRP